MEILSANQLVKTYSRRRVVDGVSLEVRAGEIVGLLGPNGAGKSTSFKMMCGLVTPDRGSVFLQGVDVTKWPLHRRSREGGMAYLPQQSSVFSKLSVHRKQQKLRTEELLEQFKITHIRKSKAGKLSGGEMRRLEIARCLVSNPKIIMLDEPFAGIDPVTVQGVQVVIRERILCSGTAEQIVAHPEVRQKYLGDIDMIPNPSNPTSMTGVSANTNQVDATQAITIAQQTTQTSIGNKASVNTGTTSIASPTTQVTSTNSTQTAPTPSASPTQNSTSTIHPSSKKNNIPLPNMPVKPAPRSRKVVAPFKSTDLDS